MINFIERHKFFFILLLSLITLAIGVVFVSQQNNTQHSDAREYVFELTLNAQWDNGDGNGGRKGLYTSADGNAMPDTGTCVGKLSETSASSSAFSDSGPATNQVINTSATTGTFTYKNNSAKETESITITITATPEGGFTCSSFDFTYSEDAKQSSITATKSGDVYTVVVEATVGTLTGGGTDSGEAVAVFTPNEYVLLLDFKGGTLNGSSMLGLTQIFYEDYNIPEGTPTKTGYSFVQYDAGIYVDGTFQVHDFDIANSHTCRIANDMEVRAIWSANSYNVVYNASGGTFSDGSTTKTVSCKYDGRYSLPETPTRSKYKFRGWFTGQNGTGTQVDSSVTFQQTTTTTLYAHWERITFDLKFDANGGSGGITSTNATIGEPYPVITSTSGWKPIKTGYTFTGFYTAKTGGAQIYMESGSVAILETFSMTDEEKVQGYKTLYAQWTEHTYYIAFDANGGSGSMSTMTMKYSDTKPLTANAFTRTGYIFSGWATSASGSVVYSDGQSVSKLTAENEATVTLYAKWTPITYTVKYNANGGTGTMSNTTATYDVSFTLSKNSFSLANKLFMGWATSASDGVTYKDQATLINLTTSNGATINLYAVWEDTWANHGEKPSGSGTESSPYLISASEHLAWIANQVNNTSTNSSTVGKYYKQTANIKLGQYTWLPIGTKNNPFIGTYNGNGYAITNLNTSSATNANGYYLNDYMGMFGKAAKKDEVTKTTLKNINILSGNIYGYQYVGSIIGSAENATISGCQNYATARGHNYLGGIVGNAVSSTIENCYVKALIVRSASNNSGGIVGYMDNSHVKSCGYDYVEGLSVWGFVSGGSNSSSTITDSFSYSPKGKNFSVGDAKVSNCLYISSLGKLYYGTDFSNWVIPSWVESTTTNRTPLPSGLSWLAIGGDKVTGLSQITALGYSAA